MKDAKRPIAHGLYDVPTRGIGLSGALLCLDPTHPELARFLVDYVLHQATAASPGSRVGLSVPVWQEAVVSAAEAAGFERRMEHLRMGIEL